MRRSLLVANNTFRLTSRHRSAKANLGVVFVPQQESWLVERMGKFHKMLQPGVNFLIPLLDSIAYVQSLKEMAIEIPQQSAITVDNVAVQLDGVLYLKVHDAYQASYGVEDPEYAIVQLAQTTMRSEVGKISLDTVFRERESLNECIVRVLNNAAAPWGIKCMRYEIKNMKMPPRIEEAMQVIVEAERKKRAAILESEGVMQAEVNVAEGRKKSTILASEAEMQRVINTAQGEAESIKLQSFAKARAIDTVAEALTRKRGSDAASLSIAEKYVQAFGELAHSSNTLIVPANAADASAMVAQALTIYKNISSSNSLANSENSNSKRSNGSKDVPHLPD